MLSIDLNCDMGEGAGSDESIMPFISSANIACGYHAGNAETIQRTIELAMKFGVAIGAHPSFADRVHFGRTEMQLSPADVYDLVTDQIVLIARAAEKQGAHLHHVKPHGALYNQAAKDIGLSEAICNAIRDFDPQIILYGLSGSALIEAASRFALSCSNEVFADRTYHDDGSLTPRSEPGALIEDVGMSTAQVMQMILQGSVKTISGGVFSLRADTICIHGDGKDPTGFAKKIKMELISHGIIINASPLKHGD